MKESEIETEKEENIEINKETGRMMRGGYCKRTKWHQKIGRRKKDEQSHRIEMYRNQLSNEKNEVNDKKCGSFTS